MAVRANIITPAKQGDLDGACGFYAITNALQLIEPKLHRPEVFKIAWNSFLRDGNPKRLVKGTTRGNLKSVLSRTIDDLNASYTFADHRGGQFSLTVEWPYWREERARSRFDIIRTLSNANRDEGCVAIIGYEYAKRRQGVRYRHWTAISRATDSGLITHDSGDEKRKILFSEIRFDSYVQTLHATRPYNVFSGDIILIKRKY